MPLSDREENDFRIAAHWWVTLRSSCTDVRTLRDFGHWLAASTVNQRAYADVEALLRNVQLAACEMYNEVAPYHTPELLSPGDERT